MHKCKSCYSNNLESIIPLGQLPLANALTNHPELNCKKYNLEVMLCKLCGLAQLKDILDPKDLFSNYLYFSSNSETMLKYAKDLVDKSVKTLQKNSRVVEIASNDGYLLKNYLNYNINILGIEPAKNIAELANKNGIKTICKFFSSKLAKNLKRQNILADIIHANNVMAHIPDINDFIKGLKIILKPKGKAIIEVPYFLDLVKNLEFDGNEEIGDEISANGDLRMKNQKVSVEAINALAASRRVVAKMQKAKESIGKKKKGLSSSYNSGKKKTTKQLGGQLKRAMKVQAGKKLS